MNAERIHREDYGRACIAGVAVTEAVPAGADFVSSTPPSRTLDRYNAHTGSESIERGRR
jgi:hypothetical protein